MVESGLEAPMLLSVFVWVLTYAIHSTILIALVWLTTLVFRRMSLSTQEALWKVALFGGIATATMQIAVGAGPRWAEFALPTALGSAPTIAAKVPAEAPRDVAEIQTRVVKHRAGDMTITTIRERRAAPESAPAMVSAAAPSPSEPSAWPWVVLGLVALGSSFAVVRLVLAWRRLRAELRGRRDVIEDPLLETFLALCHKARLGKRVRLTASAHLRSPVALCNREIVVPERAIDGLTPQQQEGMLAHELAHVIRRDPHWMVAAAIVEALLFFQPLNHFARRKIRDTAEFQCDDWAANHVGTGVHLAKCLAEVASWFERGRHDSPLAATMAEEGSPIVRRITRLLDDRRRRAQADRSVYGLALSLGLLGMVGWLAPRVSRAEAPGVAPVAQADQSRILANTFSADLHDRAVTFRDYRGEDGRARSQVRIGTPDEIVRVEVEHPRPPPPPPIPRRAAFELFIGGHVSPWSGSFEIQVHGLDQLHEDLEALFGTELEELEEAEPIAPSVFDI